MTRKRTGLWRILRTPVLMASAAWLVFGCASENPLIGEADTPETAARVAAAEAAAEAELARQEADQAASPVQSGSTAQQAQPAASASSIPVYTGRRTIEVPGTPAAEKSAQVRRQTVQKARQAALAKAAKQDARDKMSPEEEEDAENGLNSEKLTGFKKWINALSAYKKDIQQGNFVSAEMLSKIQPGMTKEQVSYVLGTPLLKDMFHSNRWDYLFRLQKPNGALTTNRVTVYFTDNVVDHIVNDALPNETEYLAHISPDEEQSEEIKEAKEKYRKRRAAEEKARAKEDAKAGRTPKPEPVKPRVPVQTQQADPNRAAADAAAAPSKAQPQQPARPQAQPAQPAQPAKPQGPVDSRTVTTINATPQQPAAGTGAAQGGVSQQPAPVQRAIAPARTPQPAAAGQAEQAPRPSYISRSSNIEEARRAHARSRASVQEVPDEEASQGKEGAIKTFEPISTPSRARKMRPASPDDQYIGNIQ